MKVLIVGDSQAAGAPGATLERLLAGAGAQVRRIAHEGHGAYDWLRMHWDEYLGALQWKPDKVVLVFGSNDLASSNLERAMRAFKSSPSNVYYAGPPRYDQRPDLQERAASIRALAQSVFGSRHLDAWPHTGRSVPRAGDGAHFTAAGGRMWGEAMARQLSSVSSPLQTVAQSRWIGPAILGGGALIAAALWWWGRR
jgi:lysophospholipase L1-like esterase